MWPSRRTDAGVACTGRWNEHAPAEEVGWAVALGPPLPGRAVPSSRNAPSRSSSTVSFSTAHAHRKLMPGGYTRLAHKLAPQQYQQASPPTWSLPLHQGRAARVIGRKYFLRSLSLCLVEPSDYRDSSTATLDPPTAKSSISPQLTPLALQRRVPEKQIAKELTADSYGLYGLRMGACHAFAWELLRASLGL